MFDVKTLVAVLVAALLIASLALTLSWRTNRSVSGVGFWAAGFGLSAIGLLAMILRGPIPPLPSILIVNTAIIAGSMSIWHGVRLFFGRKPFPVGYLAICLLGIIAADSYFTQVDDNIAIRNAITMASQVVIKILLVREFLIPPGHRNILHLYMSCVYALYALRALVFLMIGLDLGPGWTVLDSFPAAQWGYFTDIAMVNLTALGFITLTTERLQENLRRQAAMDPLTGIFNRRAFTAAANAVTARLRRENRPTSVLMMDLDRFKNVNDTHGHIIGDNVLTQFVAIARTSLREQDILCRFGGEEFVALLPDTTLNEALSVAERVRGAFAAASIESTEGLIQTTVSIGISVSERSDADLETLLKGADEAVYGAKKAGRDCIHAGYPCSASSRSISSSSHSSSAAAKSA